MIAKAGIFPWILENRLLTDQTEKSFDSVFAVNVKALFLLLQDEVKQMMAQGQGGSIVNTASVGGLLAFPTAGPYVASKHAVLGLTKTAAIEYGRYGIRVNAVSPGAVRTEMLLDVFGTQEALDEMSAVHPIGRIGRPEEIADAVAWLFSDRSSYYTGQSLILDGGLTAQRPYVTQPASDKLLRMPAMRNGEWVLKTSKSGKTKTNLGRKLSRRPQQIVCTTS
ncbi:MAG TPA: SDR family oxidoreductase [Edaphobacter sp.]|nr:SDR family oxidoreductase [Edaphobacter sp.]